MSERTDNCKKSLDEYYESLDYPNSLVGAVYQLMHAVIDLENSHEAHPKQSDSKASGE